VAVVAPSGLEADILSTSLYVMGPQRGRAWAKARGVAAVFLPHGGPVLATPAFEALKPTLASRTAP
jgi:thiamine biosynthesis lipoprotein